MVNVIQIHSTLTSVYIGNLDQKCTWECQGCRAQIAQALIAMQVIAGQSSDSNTIRWCLTLLSVPPTL